MLITKLPSLLGARRTNISKVSKETGISRTTLTALYYGDGVGVQFETLNTLCMYLGVSINEIFEFLPFDLEIGTISYCGMLKQTIDEDHILCKTEIYYSDRWTKKTSFPVDILMTLDKELESNLSYNVNALVKPDNYAMVISERGNQTVSSVLRLLGYEGERAVGDKVWKNILDDIFISRDYDFAPLRKDFQYTIEFALEE